MTTMDISLSLRTGSGKALLLMPEQAPRGTLVVAHGAGNDRLYSFAPFFDAALARGFQVLSLDLPGHGRGNTSILEVDRAVEDFTEAVVQALSHMTTRNIPWFLLGNSLGGALALRAVCEPHGGLLPMPAGVIGVGMPTRIHRGLRTTLGELPNLLSPAMRSYRPHVKRWHEVFPAFGSFRRDEFPLRSDRPNYLDAVEALLNRPWEGVTPSCPVLLVQGARDAVARSAETQRWVSALRERGATVSFEIVKTAGHLDVMLHAEVHEALLNWACRLAPQDP